MTEVPTSTTYRRLRGYAASYRGLIGAGILAMALEAAANAGTLKLLGPIVDDIFVNHRFSYWLPAGLVLLLLARGAFGLATDYAIARSGRGVARDLRMQLMEKYLRMPGARFDAEPVPSMVTRLGSDSEQVAQAAVDALKMLISNVLGIVGILVVMLWTSWRVSLVLLVMAPVLAWMMGKVGKRYRRLNHAVQESSAQMLQTADQALNAQQDVKVYGAQAAEMARYGKQTLQNLRLALKIEVTRGTLSMVVQGLGSVGLAVMLVVAGAEAAHGRLTAGDFMILLTSMVSLVPAMRQLTNVQSMLQRGIGSAERVFAVLDSEEERDVGRQPLVRARGLLEFRDVQVRYPGREAPALDGVSFVARPGTVTALVGRSGGGKSTLVKLIPRFYEPEQGEILLDGRPLSDYALADLRRQIALVGQQVMLFDGSVADNVAYGELQAADGQRLEAAVRDANAMEFISRMPDGMANGIGAKGSALSGGQRQRLAIARALLKDAPILLLDEATAALDNASERLVQDALARLIPDRTTLVVAHRLSTIEHADQILVLDEGQLVEQGTHAQLLAQGGVYAQLHAAQFREHGA